MTGTSTTSGGGGAKRGVDLKVVWYDGCGCGGRVGGGGGGNMAGCPAGPCSP